MSVTGIVLAAGKSTRMKTRKAKALHQVCGRPMLHYVLRTCWDAGCDRVLVVVGHEKEQIIARYGSDRRIAWVEQTEQLGTGHAAKACEAELAKHKSDVFILTSDGPLVRAEVLKTLWKAHKEEHADATMGTCVMDDPTGYGRIIRDAKGEFVEIIEELDCTPEQRELREVFPSLYCVKSEELLYAFARLKNQNKKHEYYLTDIFGILRAAGRKITAVQAVAQEDVLGVNTRQQLAEVDALMQDRIQRQHRENGVTIVSTAATYIEDGVSIGPDTVVQPFTFIGRDSSIGGDCQIGPFAHVPRESIVPEGTTVTGEAARIAP